MTVYRKMDLSPLRLRGSNVNSYNFGGWIFIRHVNASNSWDDGQHNPILGT
jgi:hypothetical protein